MEQQIIELIARDRLEIPLSSMYQKVKKRKSKDAKSLATLLNGEEFESARVFAHVEDEDKERARTMKDAVVEFCADFPKYGQILRGKIAEKRVQSEKHLYFGVQQGSRLTTDDYIGVMQSLGLSEQASRSLYPDLLKVSRKLEKAREEDRSIIVGKYAVESEAASE